MPTSRGPKRGPKSSAWRGSQPDAERQEEQSARPGHLVEEDLADQHVGALVEAAATLNSTDYVKYHLTS